MRPLLPSLRGHCRAALLLAAAACLTPAAASAACGDYVAVRSTDPHPDGHRADTNHGPAPCHGPNCSGSPTRDPLAPAVPLATEVGPKDGLGHGPGGPDRPAEAAPFPAPTSDACPANIPAPIFHPPRLG
ncbi:MAG TPA: hypothetical protein VH092_10035 [Urbifossiella sp.]|jgi:hypothetical protein|nr:hypothetical protein [Urbifossiella sp.]